MAWDTKSFLYRYKNLGAGMLNGKPQTINVSRLESISIKKYQNDLDMVNRTYLIKIFGILLNLNSSRKYSQINKN